MDKFTVISLGGSLIVPDEIDHQFLRKFRETVLKYVEKGYRFIIVTGGGKTCRVYQDAARKVTALSNEDVDWIGIHVTHLNGQLLRSIFRDKARLKVLTHYREREDISEPIVIAAGWKPGHSTDFDTISFAKLYNADTVINLTDTSYVYDKDPDKFKDAKPIKHIDWEEFKKIVGDKWSPGDNIPFDPIASSEAHEAGIKVVIMNGHNLENFENYLENKEFEGTVIS